MRYYALDSFPLVAVPLFIFVGNLTDRIFRFAYTLVGRMPGSRPGLRLRKPDLLGAALADIRGLGRIEIDAMRKRGCDPSFAGAVTAASATLGPIFPPSIPLIVYGSVTSVSIVQLLIAGIMPAIYDPSPVDSPDIAKTVTSSIIAGKADRRLMVCGTGVGASIAANKVKGIRAAVCHDVHSAHQSVEQ